MEKYFLVVKNTWDEIVTYRLNFIMWRVRTVLQLITTYFLWLVLVPKQGQLFGYSQTQMITYVLGTALVGAIVFATRTQEIGDNINSGTLSIFLIRPINYFGYWLARDLGDKAMNIAFSLGELTLLYLILKPVIFLQTNVLFIVLASISILFAVLLQFVIGSLLGMIGFWSPEVWAPRFIYMILVTFLAGSFFPLDILPSAIRTFMEFLPFQYLLYFPIKMYMGKLTLPEIFYGLSITVTWCLLLSGCLYFIWKKGLRDYTAVGR